MKIEHLFVYGSLAPGQSNAHVLAQVPGDWTPATVTGVLRQEGWGAALGYPGLVLDATGAEVRGMIFSSAQLCEHWERLDAFEGDGYERVVTCARLDDGTAVQAHVYVLHRDRAQG